jgi:hypothetical protein
MEEKTINELLQSDVEKFAVSDEVTKILEERIALRRQSEEVAAKYAMCLRENICPKCGKRLTLHNMPKIPIFDKFSHVKKDVTRKRVLVCECKFEFEIMESQNENQQRRT